jgi:hypothetical protein
MRLLLVAFVLFMAGASQAQVATPAAADDFGTYVVLAHGDTLRGSVALRATGDRHVLYNSEKRYDLKYLKSIRTDDAEYSVVTNPSPWISEPVLLKLVQNGRLSLYSSDLSVPGPYATTPRRSGSRPEASVEYVRLPDGQMMPITHGNLKKVVADRPEAMRHLNQYSAAGYVGYSLMAVGVGILGAGVYLMLAPQENAPNPWLVAGVGGGVALTAGLMVPLMQGGKLRMAINAYNR